ncbi:hypothetical protein SAMN05216379_12625 [Nitrosomonas eutropha]|uniref:Glycine-rich domain-containing protein-like n=2 Tax=Nitrosomonas eutropha TaxID=916 RepID=A0A1G4WMG0_9PROT|nr:hypothetical protein [Nitrosomonas eutropha]SCX25204.1 hypothetical protein SAMN05216379_12625 [Nitrosomonas eutropha]SFU27383.1 hypothetical protein SAMN05216339_10121 [Nitrosomonas eutropha]
MNEKSLTDLDLEPIMVKVMDKEEGLGWSLDFTRRVASEYEKYLILCKENPDVAVIPSSSVDDFWHFHILDTQKYQEDCQNYFGYFLHHFPYFGMRGKEDEENLKAAWGDSRVLYEARFGKLPTDLWLASKRCPNCGRRADPSGYAMDQRPKLAITA